MKNIIVLCFSLNNRNGMETLSDLESLGGPVQM